MHKDVLKEILTLSTAAFGLVAALAWNEAIQAIVNKYLSDNGGIVSKLIYAVVVTVLAVIVTVNLTKFKDRFEDKPQENK